MKLVKIKVRERRLRYYWGYAHINKNLVEITPNLTDRQYLDTLIHEILHILYPKNSETRVSREASTITHHIWKKGYRRVHKQSKKKRKKK
jgi:tagatose-1,6-bisphosphate aldolase non-catalytic subunit AgaZ/GatZ